MSFARSAAGVRSPTPPRTARVLVVISVYKFVKMAACFALAMVAFNLLRPDVADRFEHWLESLTWATRHGVVMHTVGWLLGLGPKQFQIFGVAAIVYALLYGIQGFGLWCGKRWAEYLVIVETCVLVPVEVWELAHRYSAFKLVVLTANVAIMIYLIGLLRRHDQVSAE
ncbi:MAG: DUF2127 domain-containing protein [Dokdonella sp.]